MKVRDINNDVKELINPKHPTKNKLRNVLSNIFNIIERFEKYGEVNSKNDRDKVDILKNVVSDMVKDEDNKRVIAGASK